MSIQKSPYMPQPTLSVADMVAEQKRVEQELVKRVGYQHEQPNTNQQHVDTRPLVQQLLQNSSSSVPPLVQADSSEPSSYGRINHRKRVITTGIKNYKGNYANRG